MGNLFAKKYWSAMDSDTLKAGWFGVIMAVIWGLISIGLYFYEGPRGYFDLKAILQFKIIWVAVIFLGRYFLFPLCRNHQHFPWILLTSLLVMLGMNGNIFWLTPFKLYYLILKVLDTLIWGLFVALFLEVAGVVFANWIRLQKVNYANLYQLWQRFWNEAIALGAWFTFISGLIYFYLTSFYLIDTLIYSYLLLLIVVLTGLSLFMSLYIQVKEWVNRDLHDIDQELHSYLQFQRLHEEEDFYRQLLQFEYLMLLRDYLLRFAKPKISGKGIFVYLVCSGFLISLPYIFGLIVEVGSFK